MKATTTKPQNNPWNTRTQLLCLFPIALCSCGVSPVPMDQAFRQNRKAKVAVVTIEAPQATVIHEGGQGLLDIAINQAIASGGRKRLQSYPSQAKLDEVGGRFAKRLGSLGYRAKLIDFHPSKNEINPSVFKPSSSKPLPGLDSYLKGYDAALFLDMAHVGQSKLVSGFVPLSGLSATASLSGAMFDTSGTGKCIWKPRPSPPSKQPPEGSSSDMPKVFRDIDQAVEAQAHSLAYAFFTGL